MDQELKRIQEEYARRKKEVPEDYYSLKHPGNRFIYESRASKATQLLKNYRLFPLEEKRILEVGCGTGQWLLDFKKWGAQPKNLAGVDLLEERIQQAKESLPEADLRLGDASQMPWPDAHFDLILQSTVFTSILDDALRKSLASEMKRVLKLEGVILWYDFFVNNPKNPHVRGVSIKEVKSYFSDCEIYFEKITLAPPLARCLAPNARPFCEWLEKLQIFNTHYFGLIQKKKN